MPLLRERARLFLALGFVVFFGAAAAGWSGPPFGGGGGSAAAFVVVVVVVAASIGSVAPPSASQALHPPRSGRALLKPLLRRIRAARALVFSLGQAQ